MGGRNKTGADKSFARYQKAARERFSFLEPAGYGEPRVHTYGRECTIVYWGQERANVSIFYDLGGPPWVQIIPLWLANEDGSTRAFGLNEAIALLDPALDKARPETRAARDHGEEIEWLDWYAAFLKSRLDAITRPSEALVSAIEASRPSEKWWELL